MIVKMKKVSLIVMDRHRESALSALRKIGIVHVESDPVSNEDIADLTRRRDSLIKAIEALPDNVPEPGPVPHLAAEEVARNIHELIEQGREAYDEISAIETEIARITPWGGFDPADLTFLEEKGHTIKLYEAPRFEKMELDSPESVFVISREKTMARIAAVDTEIDEAIEFVLPRKSLKDLESDLAAVQKRREQVHRDLESMNRYRSVLETGVTHLSQEIEFHEVKSGMEDDDVLSLLKGYVPVTKLGELKNAAASNGWGLLLRDPEPDDAVPSLVKTSKPVSLIKPIFQLIGTIPGYREFDISLPFLLFFTVFFAMIIGDGGYGLIFFAGSVFAMVKTASAGKKIPKAISLLLVLSTATMAWGAITGTWFGSEYLASLSFLNWMVIPTLSSFDPRSSDTIKWLCFIIGTFHISIARIWSFIRELSEKPFIRAFRQIGWLSLVLGLYYLVLNIVLDPVLFPVPRHALMMIGGGIVFVILFSEQQGKFFLGLAKGFAGLLTTFLDSIGVFSDIISYIRLFAVGLASIEIAKAFNTMAAGMGTGAVGIAAAVFVLLIGHTLNLAMGALSVIVHGVRLNILEFSGHLGIEWTGFAYRPFGNEGSEE